MPFDETLVDKGSFFYWVPEGETPPPVGDGVNYSRALGWQSPEGNFYGQERWVRDWHSAVIWTGEDYEVLETDGTADSIDDLPIPGEINPRTGEAYGPRLPFEIWTVPRPNWPPADMEVYDGRLLDYYWWDVDNQEWKLAEWYWLCEGEEALPRPGVKLGACHIIVYYDIKVMWNGYYWKRFSMEMIEGSERVDVLEELTELASGQITEIQGDYNELVGQFSEYQKTVTQELIDNTKFATLADKQLGAYISETIEDITSYSTDSSITESEADDLKLTLNRINSESNKVVAIATELGVVTEREAYVDALEVLESEIDVWIDKAYPLTVVAQDKEDILFCANELQDRFDELHIALQEEFDGTIVDYTVEQLQDVSNEIGDITEDIAEFTDDSFITFVESKALKISFEQLDAESTDIVAIATGIEAELEVVWSEKTAYINALEALEIELAKWVGLSEVSYPVAVLAQDRININSALRLVKSTRDTLAKKIRDADVDYIDLQIGEVSGAVEDLSDDVLEFSDDGFITFTESINLKLSLVTLNKESIDLVSVATSLGVTTEKTNYSTALTNLSNAITPWIDLAQSAYPKAVTPEQRSDLILRLETVENTKSLLVNEIIRKRQEDVAKYVNNQISDANSSLTALYNEWNNRVSDDYITYAEAESSRLVMAQFLAEVDALKAIADGVDEDALGLAYQNAALALTGGIGALINETYTYPVSITSGQKSAILVLFSAATSAKRALIDALTVTETYGVGGVGFDVSQFRLVFNGLIRGFTPELKLVFVSANELSLQPNYTDYSYLKVNDQNIQASARTSVYTQTPVLAWSDNTQAFTQSTLVVDTPYWVYLANRNDCFNIESGSTPYDYRGRLFCSGTEPSNNYLGELGDGLNAILVGRAQTHASDVAFLHEYGVSYISRTTDLKETFREYSDFDLVFVDSETLRLQQNYGSYGQIYIPEGIYYIGDDREVYTTSTRLELDINGNLVFDYSTIAANETYYVYIAGDVDIYNNNDVNAVTNRPWHPEDSDPTPSLYDADKDLRLYLFLSTQIPDNGRLSETYNGFWTRWVGIIQTDDNAKFKYSNNLSMIRQATLNPTDIDDIANVSLVPVSENSFKIIKKTGTNGVVYVSGIPTYTYDVDSPLVHSLNITSNTKTYTESNISSPLSDSGVAVNTLVTSNIYIYLANNRSFWGATANSIFFSTLAPTSGYLSQNWPGNQCRWICTISLSPATYSSELVTNGTFATNGTWTWGTGWTHDSDDKKAYHSTPSATDTLSQSITVVAGSKYELIASIRDRSAGGVSVTLGGNEGQVLWANMSVQQYILATTTGGLIFTPNESFDGSVDSVTCKKILTGNLSGSYVTSSVGFSTAFINDSVTSYNDTWSSAKIMEELNKLATQFGLSNESQDQANAGLPLILEYYSTTQVSLKCTLAIPVVVVFPDNTTITIDSAGFVGTVTGSVDTTYYIYIDKDSATDGFHVTTDAPDAIYPNKQTLGDTYILVGYVAFSVTDTIAGNWNVYSFWNEPTREWSSGTIDSEAFTFAKAGLIIPPDGSATLARTGTTTATFTGTPGYDMYLTATASIGIGTQTGTTSSGSWGSAVGAPQWDGSAWYWVDISPSPISGSITVSLSPGASINSGVYNSVSLSASKSVTGCPAQAFTGGPGYYYLAGSVSSSSSYTARSGNLTITRIGNV